MNGVDLLFTILYSVLLLGGFARLTWCYWGQRPQPSMYELREKIKIAERHIVQSQHLEWAASFRMLAGHEWNQDELDRRAGEAAARMKKTQLRVNSYSNWGLLSVQGQLVTTATGIQFNHPASNGLPGGYVPLRVGESIAGCGCQWCMTPGGVVRKYVG